MSVLVTGGCGYLGLHVLKRLSEEGWSVVGYDLNIVGENLLKQFYRVDTTKVKLVRGDVLEITKILETVRRYGITHIVHLATLLTRESEENPPRAFKVNVESTINLLEISRLVDIEKFVFASSEAIYGITGDELIREDRPKNPISIYGITKLTAEYVGFRYRENHGIDFIALRYPMIYGPGAYAGGARLINYIVEGAIKGVPVTIQFSGRMRVEPLYVYDAATAVHLALRSENTVSGAYNIGVGRIYSLAEIVDVLRELYPNVNVSFGETPGYFIYPVQGPLSIERARSELGFRPVYDLATGIKHYAQTLFKGYLE